MTPHATHFSGCDCVMDKIQKLEAENARFMEALENILRSNYGGYAEDIAREALRGDITPDKGEK